MSAVAWLEKIKSIVATFLLLLLLVAPFFLLHLSGGHYATVIGVTDESTIEARIRVFDFRGPINIGPRRTIALAGIETIDQGSSASALRDLLKPGTDIYLRKASQNKDANGRLLRYVWTQEPDEYSLADGFVNAALVSLGHAVCKDPEQEYKDVFIEITTERE